MNCPYCNKEMKLGEITSKWKHPIVKPQLYAFSGISNITLRQSKQ